MDGSSQLACASAPDDSEPEMHHADVLAVITDWVTAQLS